MHNWWTCPEFNMKENLWTSGVSLFRDSLLCWIQDTHIHQLLIIGSKEFHFTMIDGIKIIAASSVLTSDYKQNNYNRNCIFLCKFCAFCTFFKLYSFSPVLISRPHSIMVMSLTKIRLFGPESTWFHPRINLWAV